MQGIIHKTIKKEVLIMKKIIAFFTVFAIMLSSIPSSAFDPLIYQPPKTSDVVLYKNDLTNHNMTIKLKDRAYNVYSLNGDKTPNMIFIDANSGMVEKNKTTILSLYKLRDMALNAARYQELLKKIEDVGLYYVFGKATLDFASIKLTEVEVSLILKKGAGATQFSKLYTDILGTFVSKSNDSIEIAEDASSFTEKYWAYNELVNVICFNISEIYKEIKINNIKGVTIVSTTSTNISALYDKYVKYTSTFVSYHNMLIDMGCAYSEDDKEFIKERLKLLYTGVAGGLGISELNTENDRPVFKLENFYETRSKKITKGTQTYVLKRKISYKDYESVLLSYIKSNFTYFKDTQSIISNSAKYMNANIENIVLDSNNLKKSVETCRVNIKESKSKKNRP